MSAETTERAEALAEIAYGRCSSVALARAQVHATLYVGDQLSRIADALTGETEAYITTYDGGRAGP